MDVFIEQTHCDSHRLYPRRDECLWRTRGARPIPNLASCTVWGIPRIPSASFPYCNIHQSFSQNSSVASCLLLLPAPPGLLKKLPPSFFPFANSLPLVCPYDLIDLNFSHFFHSSSPHAALTPDLPTARLLHPGRHSDRKAHPVPPASLLSSSSAVGKLGLLLLPFIGPRLSPRVYATGLFCHFPLARSPHPSTLCNDQKPTPLSPRLTHNPYNRLCVFHLRPPLLALPYLLTPSHQVTIERIPATPIRCPWGPSSFKEGPVKMRVPTLYFGYRQIVRQVLE